MSRTKRELELEIRYLKEKDKLQDGLLARLRDELVAAYRTIAMQERTMATLEHHARDMRAKMVMIAEKIGVEVTAEDREMFGLVSH